MTVEMEQLWGEYDLDRLTGQLGRLFPESTLDLKSVWGKVLTGQVWEAICELWEGVAGTISLQSLGIREMLIWIVTLGLLGALLTHFVGVFENHQIADMSFYFVYLLLTTVLLRCLQQAVQITTETLQSLVEFMQLFIPTYLLAVGVTTGTATAGAYYGILLLIIYLVQKVLFSLAVPAIFGYVLLAIINGVWMEEKLSLLVEFFGKAIGLLLKVSLGAVTGISVFQSMITPAIDSLKTTALQKTVSAIPGIGNMAEGVVDMVLGSAVVIKNSIGLVALLLLFALCLLPLLRILLLSLLLKLAAAVMGIISDKRITHCTDMVGNGCTLLFRTTGTAMLLFLIAISVAAFTTNRGF